MFIIINLLYKLGSPSPSKTLSPARMQNMRHVMQNHSMDGMPTTNGMANGFTQMQMNFEYNQNSNPNGLELAGFCSPSQGKK